MLVQESKFASSSLFISFSHSLLSISLSISLSFSLLSFFLSYSLSIFLLSLFLLFVVILTNDSFQCISVPYGKKKEALVVLSQQQRSPDPAATPKPSPSPFPANLDQEKQNEIPTQAVPVAPSILNEPLAAFKNDIVELLNSMPDKKLSFSHIPEEYSKHFKRPYVLANYGGKKTATLMKSIPDIVMVCIQYYSPVYCV